MAKKPAALPPLDVNDEIGDARTMLNRYKKQLATLPLEWRRWLIGSLSAWVAQDELPLDKETE